MSLHDQSNSDGGVDSGGAGNSYVVGPGQIVMHLLILSICALAFGLTFLFEEVPAPLQRGMAPETFPRGVSILAFILTCASLFRSVQAGGFKSSQLTTAFYLSVLGCAIFLFVANWIDLLIAMVLFIVCMCWIWGERRKLVIIALAIGLPVLIFILFSEALGIRFPRGVLVNLIYG